jgi:multiple antibiotic resistance protein
MWETFLKSFIPLFVALDVLGVLPLYVQFSHALDEARRGRILKESTFTAFLVTIGFVLLGNAIMHYLGISINDFMIAGGVILFLIAAKEMLGGGREEPVKREDLFAVVPLGIPLLAGPAVLTTSLIIYNSYGFGYLFVSLMLNLLICGLAFRFSGNIMKWIGGRWVEAISKVFMLLLASIAVMFIRTGMTGVRLP